MGTALSLRVSQGTRLGPSGVGVGVLCYLGNSPVLPTRSSRSLVTPVQNLSSPLWARDHLPCRALLASETGSRPGLWFSWALRQPLALKSGKPHQNTSSQGGHSVWPQHPSQCPGATFPGAISESRQEAGPGEGGCQRGVAEGQVAPRYHSLKQQTFLPSQGMGFRAPGWVVLARGLLGGRSPAEACLGPRISSDSS